MSMAQDMAWLTEALLELEATMAVIEEASVKVQTAQNKLLNVVQNVNAAQGGAQSTTLMNAVKKARLSMRTLAFSLDTNAEAIHRAAASRELINNYVDRMLS